MVGVTAVVWKLPSGKYTPDPPDTVLLITTLPYRFSMLFDTGAVPVPMPTLLENRLCAPPTFRLPPMPTPPPTSSAPLAVLVLTVVLFTVRLPICTGPLR